MKKVYLTLGALALATAGFSQTVVFDQESSIVPVTGAYGQFTHTYAPVFTSTSSDFYNQAGENINLGTSGANITGLDFLYVTGPNIGSTDDISVVVNIYNKFTNSTSSSSAEYSSLLSTTTINLGSGFTGGYIYGASADFDPVSGNFLGPNDNYALNSALATGSSVGVTFTFLDNGAATENVGIALDAGLADAVGSNANSALDVFYANNAASSHNLTGKSAIAGGGTELDLAMTLYATPAPEPVSMTFLGLGAVGLIAKRRRAKR